MSVGLINNVSTAHATAVCFWGPGE